MRTDVASGADDPYAIPTPALYCPLPEERHPGRDLIARRSVEFLTRIGLCADVDGHALVFANRATDWCCRVAPRSTVERLQVVSDWVHLGFLIDDQRFDKGPLIRSPGRLVPMMMQLLQALEHPEAGPDGDPFAAGWRDVSRRVRAHAHPAVARRWADGNLDWFFAVSCLVGHRVAGTMPTLDQYVNLGPRDRGMRLVGSLVEIGEGTNLPDTVREEPAVRAFTQAAYLLVTIASDVFSFCKESADQVLESNTVGVIRHARGCSGAEAMQATVALHDRVMCRYLRLRDVVGADAGPALQVHVRQMDRLVRGNIEWSATTPRYAQTRRSERVTSEVPGDDAPGPPGLANIDWWWAV